jgi:hypothetical protein
VLLPRVYFVLSTYSVGVIHQLFQVQRFRHYLAFIGGHFLCIILCLLSIYTPYTFIVIIRINVRWYSSLSMKWVLSLYYYYYNCNGFVSANELQHSSTAHHPVLFILVKFA